MFCDRVCGLSATPVGVVSTGYGCVDQQHKSVDQRQACRHVALYSDTVYLLDVSQAIHAFLIAISASYRRRSLGKGKLDG